MALEGADPTILGLAPQTPSQEAQKPPQSDDTDQEASEDQPEPEQASTTAQTPSESDSEPPSEAEGDEEGEDRPSGAEKRISQLIAENKKRSKTEERLRLELQQMNAQIAELRGQIQKAADPGIPEPGEDASPEEIRAYFDKVRQLDQKRLEQEIADAKLSGQVEAVRMKYEDYDYLWGKWAGTIRQDPALVSHIERQSNQALAFYKEASKMEKLEEETIMGETPDRQSARGAIATPPSGHRSPGGRERFDRAAFEEAKRMFPMLYGGPDGKERFAKAYSQGEQIRNKRAERRGYQRATGPQGIGLD